MFLLGSFITIGWVFCNFYYEDAMPRSWNVGMMFAGLFTMGYGLLKGKQFYGSSGFLVGSRPI